MTGNHGVLTERISSSGCAVDNPVLIDAKILILVLEVELDNTIVVKVIL